MKINDKYLLNLVGKFLLVSYAGLTIFILSYAYLNRNAYISDQDLITPIILSSSQLELTEAEKIFFKKANPFGFILGKENLKSYDQTKKLIKEFHDLFPNRKVYVTIDQEGGRVLRLERIINNPLRSAFYYSKLAKKDLAQAKKEIYQDSKKSASILHDLGIDIVYGPVLDIMYYDKNLPKNVSWIGKQDRSYGYDWQVVTELAKEFIRGMHEEKVLTTLKHIPGIGRSRQDTHDEEVSIDATLDVLKTTDFMPFKELANATSFAMIGHTSYSQIDDQPAIFSKKIVDIIRGGDIGFKGFLITDALNMKALDNYSLEERVVKSFNAGVDIIILHYTFVEAAGKAINSMNKEDIIRFNKKLKSFEKDNKF